MMHGHTYIKIA